MSDTQKGVLAVVAACVIWGFSPLFYKALSAVDPTEVLAHRTVWSFVFFAAVLAMQSRLAELWAVVANRTSLKITIYAALLISVNWFFFIWSVQVERTTETSLGYYAYPLIAVVVGRVVFAERLSVMQMVAVGLACLAVLTLILGLYLIPWISILLASTFAAYGLIKKNLAPGPVVSVTAEVLILAPIALVWLGFLHSGAGGVYGRDLTESLLLMASGPITALPLIFFSYGARRLAMSTVGIVQYINPTLQFICAVVIFGEPFGPVHLVAFALIWTALALYSASAVRQDKARRKAEMVSEVEAVVSTKPNKDASAKP